MSEALFFPASDCRRDYHGIVLAIAGPPHSGKSVFLAELYRQLLKRQASKVFLHRACPDGEGMWSDEANPEIVQQIRRKFAFSEEFITVTLRGIERMGCDSTHGIVLLDLGGKRTAENAEILRRSTHCIILSSQSDEIPLWQTFARAEGCEAIALFQSQLVYGVNRVQEPELDLTARSTLQVNATPLRGTFVNLDRNLGSDCYQQAIGELAEVLVSRYLK